MAVIKPAAPVAGIRGTVGGLTYPANKARPFHPSRTWPSILTTTKVVNQWPSSN